MKNVKRALSLFLTIALILAVIPTIAYADTPPNPMDDAVEAIEAIMQNAKDAEKNVLKNREEQKKNNTIEVTSGSNKGFVLEDGKTYVFKKDVTFTNTTPSESAISVPTSATVTMYIEKGVTVTAVGADSVSSLGAGAGIHVPETATLIIRGEGTLKATGGNGGNGENGSKGEDAVFDQSARNGGGNIYGGNGGNGGNGGGGAGAGIGGVGGNGGEGGEGGLYKGYKDGKYTIPYNDKIADILLISKEEGITDKLFDNDTNTECYVKKTGTVSVVFRTSKPEKAVSYGLVTSSKNTEAGELPSGWIMYGSNNGIDWKTISTVKSPDISKSATSEFKYNIDKVGTYKYFKIDFAVTGGLRLSEINLYREKSEHPASPTDKPTADLDGSKGKNGKSGSYGEACGSIYIIEHTTVIAEAGKSGVAGKPGSTGQKASDKGSGFKYNYFAGGGGGGGAGAGGETPEFGIGSGGAGGAGGGGGGSGSTRWTEADDYGDSSYGKGGKGGEGYHKGEGGRGFGSQWGGRGGSGGDPLEKTYTVTGFVRADLNATVQGRLDGDIERGNYWIDDNGLIADSSGIPVTDIENLKLEDNKIYRFEKNITYTAAETENAITIPENSKIIFEVPNNIKVNLKGGNAGVIKGAGAGILVPSSSTLIIRGSGVLEATGGNASKASSTDSGGGAGAGIGGKGGKGIIRETATPERGTDCGKIYILGSIRLTATPGKGSDSDSSAYCGGKAPDYGIGGGGAGGNAAGKPIQLSGNNGDIYIDYTSIHVTGRDSFYHRADLSIDPVKNIKINGYSDMILGSPYVKNMSREYLYKALREVANHLNPEKNIGWKVIKPEGQEGIETKDSLKGAYRKGNEWNKDILDNSGGYVYLFTTYFGRYIKDKYDDGDNPASIVNSCWSKVKQYAKENKLYISDDMKTLMSEILYSVHYCEPFGDNRSSGYIKDNPTSERYGSKNKALQQIDYSYTSVLDCLTARYATFAYDTERVATDKSFGNAKYYYAMISSSFRCVDGYKGVTMKNWMNFIPDSASVSQLNMPGTHDSGTYNVKYNPEIIDVVLNNFDKIYSDNVPVEATIGASAGITLLAALSPAFAYAAPLLFTVITTVLATYGIAKIAYIAANFDEMMQLLINSLAQCNNLTLDQQMNAGIRTFDIRMIYNSEKNHEDLKKERPKGADRYYEADYLKISHGSLGTIGFDKYSDFDVSLTDGHNPDGSLLTFKNVIEDSLAFVKENPSESVYLTFKCEGKDKGEIYKTVLDKVFAQAKDDPHVVVLGEKDKMPTVGEAAGKVYLIERRFAEFRDDSYDVSAEKKIKILEDCFAESDGIEYRQKYDAKELIKNVRMIYSSTYDYSFNTKFIYDPFEDVILFGSPEELAIGSGRDSVNHFLDTYGYQRGQHYGWIYMNFPTQMATSNLVFSNIFDMKKLVNEHDEGSIFTNFNGIVFATLAVLGISAVAIPIIRKSRSKKDIVGKGKEDNKE